MKISLDGFSIHVHDVEKSLEYYSKLNGAVVLMHELGHIAQVSIGKGRLNLVKLDRQPPFHLEFEVDNIDEVYEELKHQGFLTEGKPETKPWGETTFYLIDPEGNLLEFSKSELDNNQK